MTDRDLRFLHELVQHPDFMGAIQAACEEEANSTVLPSTLVAARQGEQLAAVRGAERIATLEGIKEILEQYAAKYRTTHLDRS